MPNEEMKSQKHEARQPYKAGLMEKSRYQRSAEEEHHIERKTHDDIEPEHRVVVAVGGMFQVDQSLRESAALQVASNECKDGEYADDSIVGRREQACQEDAEQDVEHLCGATVHSSPKQSFSRFLL